MATVTLEYYACFGGGDYGETIEWNCDLTDEEYAAYCQAKEDGIPFEDIPLLQAVLDRVRLEIIEADDSLADYDEDEYNITVCFAEE